MAVAVTNEQIVLNVINPITQSAATSSVIDAVEVFTFTPAERDNRYLILINNVTAGEGTITWSIAAGDAWAAGDALTGSVAQTIQSAIVLEGGKYLSEDGTIVITFTPASGKRLLTDHAMTATGIKMP